MAANQHRRLHWLAGAVDLWLLVAMVMTGCSEDTRSEDDNPGQGCSGAACVDAVTADVPCVSQCGDPWADESTGAVATYKLSPAIADWHNTPFPTDLRRKADGKLDLSGFPTNRKGEIMPLLDKYVALGAATLDGFSIAPTIYVRFDAPLDPKQMPTIEETQAGDGFFFLLDVTADSPEYGRRFPLQWKLRGDARGQIEAANLLAVQITWGVPLRPNTTYAFVMRRRIRDLANKVLARPPDLAAVLDAHFDGQGTLNAPQQALSDSLKPLFEAMSAGEITVNPKAIAAATVFTTARPINEIQRMASWVRSNTKRAPAYDWQKWEKKDHFKLVRARYAGPNFQSGKVPYLTEGGGFVFDAKGDPVIQATEDALRIALAVPDDKSQMVGGKLPVVIYSHGTGGTYDGFRNQKVIDMLCQSGLAVIGIEQPLHGTRGGSPPLSADLVDQASFNFLNPESGRSTFRQAVLDNVFLIEMLRDGMVDIPAGFGPSGDKVRFDANRMLFFGHSQGGIVGALLTTVEPYIRAFVLSGAGGGLSLTAMLRKKPLDFAKVVKEALVLDEGELSEFHPALAMIQMLVDITDPLAYGRHAFERGPEHFLPHILLTEGLLDEATPSATAEALATAFQMAIRYPAVHKSAAMEAIGTMVIAPPFRNNLAVGGKKVTSVLVQYAKGNHFIVFSKKGGQNLAHSFLFRVATEGEPLIEN